MGRVKRSPGREPAVSGARLVLADLDVEKAHALARELGFPRTGASRADIAEAADVEAMVAFAVDGF